MRENEGRKVLYGIDRQRNLQYKHTYMGRPRETCMGTAEWDSGWDVDGL